MLTNSDITIYNKYIDNRVAKYKRTVINKVHWEEGQKSNIEKTGIADADEATVFIPFTSAKNYYTPKNFLKDNQGFTLKGGDIIVRGVINDEINSIKDLSSKYDFVHIIDTVDINDFGSNSMQHFEVGLK